MGRVDSREEGTVYFGPLCISAQFGYKIGSSLKIKFISLKEGKHARNYSQK